MHRYVLMGIGMAIGMLLYRLFSFGLGLAMVSSLGLLLAGHTGLAVMILGIGVLVQWGLWRLIVRER